MQVEVGWLKAWYNETGDTSRQANFTAATSTSKCLYSKYRMIKPDKFTGQTAKVFGKLKMLSKIGLKLI